MSSIPLFPKTITPRLPTRQLECINEFEENLMSDLKNIIVLKTAF